MQISNLPRKKLIWRSYIIAEALPTTKRVEIIDKKKFAKLALDKHIEAFVIYVTSLNFNSMPIYPAQEAQIILLVIEEMQILSEYLDFSDVFLEKKASILPKATNLNQHAIKLQESDKWKLAFQTRYDYFKYQVMSSGYLMLRQASRVISIKFQLRNLTSSLLFIRMTSLFIPRIWARAM